MIRAVVFDLDDTLISEKEYIKSGYKHLSRIISVDIGISDQIIFNDLMELFIENARNVFNRLYTNYNIEYTKEMIMNLVDEYRGHFPNIKFYDDVMPCLIKLKDKGIKTGIITDGYAIAQRQKLSSINAYELFLEVIVTDELGKHYWKPNFKAFELMKNKLGLGFEEMLYVGDNPEKDFYIGRKYPIKTCRIMRKGAVHSNKSYYSSVKESIRINSLTEIFDYIE